MKLAIMQPYFFPYIGYFQCIQAVDKYILYENIDYIKEGWMHRNKILIKNNNPSYINAKTIGRSSNKKIFEIQLDTSLIWKKKLINTILLNYKGSHHFDEIFPIIEKLINSDHILLFEYNACIVKGIIDFLEIETELVIQNKNYLFLEDKLNNLDNNDYSQFAKLKLTKPVKKVARVLEICENEGASIFINAFGGQELYDKNEFKKYNLDLLFVKTNEFEYAQFSDKFHPNLSIIDVLMHNGKEGTKKILNQYELI